MRTNRIATGHRIKQTQTRRINGPTHIEHGYAHNNAKVPPPVPVEDIESCFQELVRSPDGTISAITGVVWVREVSSEVVDEKVHVVATGECIWRLDGGELRVGAANLLTTNG